MSSITFPHAILHPHASSSSIASLPDEDEDRAVDPAESFYSSAPSFVELSNSSFQFQMNPLSTHPPRTPRTSLRSHNTSHHYASEASYSVNEGGGSAQETPASLDLSAHSAELDAESGDLAEEDFKKDGKSKVRKEEVWRDLLKTTVGRDKALKLLQYSLKVYLLFHYSLTASGLFSGASRRRPWELELVKRVESTVAGFSLTRRCLILFEWLTPLTSILAPRPVPFSSGTNSTSKPVHQQPLLHTFLHAPPPVLLDLLNGAADDVYTFYRLGLLGARTGQRAGKFADWCWFASTLVNLVENSVEMSIVSNQLKEVETRLYAKSMTGATAKSTPTNSKIDDAELRRLQQKEHWLQITRTKLLMDLIFVSYDVFQFKRAKAPMQVFSGLAAAVLSTAKVYDRHKNALVKTLSY